MKKIKLLMVTLAALFVLVPALALAEDSSGTNEANKKANEQRLEEAKKALEKQQEEAKKALEKKQEDAKKRAEELKKQLEDKREAFKKACENRRENFKDRMENVAERSKKRWETADKIVEHIKSFVSEKNLTVANYDQLLVDVQTKRQALIAAHEQAKENIPSFSCEKEKDEVKSSIQDFKTAVSKENEARKAYRDSIKALIKAVKEAAQAAKPEDSNG